MPMAVDVDQFDLDLMQVSKCNGRTDDGFTGVAHVAFEHDDIGCCLSSYVQLGTSWQVQISLKKRSIGTVKPLACACPPPP